MMVTHLCVVQLNPQEEIRILHVDDDPSIVDLTGTFLEREDNRFNIETATSADEGLQRLTDRPPDCIVSDYDMPGMNGLKFLQAVRKEHPNLPFILFTGKGSEEVASEALTAGATDYIQKQSGSEQYELLANRIGNAVGQYRSQKRLSETRKEYTTIFENAQNALLLIDVEDDGFRYRRCNPRATELIGRDRTEIVAARPCEALGPENGTKVVGAYRKCVQQREPVTYTVTLDLPVGQVIRDCEVTPVISDGEIERLVVEFRDITKQHQRQRELEKIETLFQHAQDSLFLIDVTDEFIIERVNPAYEDETGVSTSEIQGQTPEQLFDEEQARAVEARYSECVNRQEPLQYTEELQFGSEPSYWETRIAPVELDGSVEYIAGATRDVTEHKEREQELREERQFIEQALDALDDLFYVLDMDSTLRRWNDRVPEITGYSDDDLTGMQAVELFPEDEREAVADNIATTLADGEATVEADLRTADGRRLPCEFIGAQLTDEEGSVTGLVGVGRDITERKEREQRLAETTRQLQAVLDTVDATVVIKDVCGEYQYANKKARENLDVGVDEDITGLTDHDLLPADVAAQYRVDDRRVIEAGDTIEIEERVPTPGGTQINRTLKSPFYDADGELTGVCAVSTDITERKKREQRLSRLKTLMSEMEKLADMGAWEYDPETGEVTNTAGTKRIYGLEPEAELTLEEAFEFFHPADRDQLRNRFESCLETGEPYEIDVRIITADGEEKWITAQGQQVNSQDDTPVLRGYIRDITAQKERLAQLEQIETLFENAQDMLFLVERTDEEFIVRRVNEAFERVTGLSNEQLHGKTPREVFGPERGREIEQRYQQCLNAGEPLDYQEAVEARKLPEKDSPDESERTYWETKIAPVATSENTEWIVGATRDINERKRRQRELERQNERLEEFTSVVSHDLRNPLQTANGWLELAQADCDSAHLDDASDALDRMDTLIEDLLTLARNDETVERAEEVSVSVLAEQCWKMVPKEGATLTVETDRTVSADRTRLRQLLENLFANAVEHGGNDVNINVGSLADGFYVADDGAGIPKGEREDVFEPGYSTTTDGTGFGLRIVKQIADAHGWDICVTDSENDGARFEITEVDTVE